MTGRRLTALYAVEAATSFAATLLLVGIFFYTTRIFGWGMLQNFILAATQGCIYVVGALVSARITRRVGRRALLSAGFLVMGLIAASALLFKSPIAVGVVLVAYTFTSALNWPPLESLVSSGVGSQALSRRIGVYNLVWSSTGALAVAVQGRIIDYWPAGVFLIPAIFNVCSSAVLFVLRHAGEAVSAVDQEVVGQARPELDLVRSRRLALWLSRICLPATYVVIYSLSAMLPLLPVIKGLSTSAATLVGSVWSVSRTIVFVGLGSSVWWHCRPRILLGAAALMLLAFLGVVVQPSSLFPTGASAAIDLASMVIWQALLGAAIGVIYFASLYFGMVLSSGSTEHGGYHEALIGCGQVVGPLAGAMTQVFWPGSVMAGTAAVSSILALSVGAAAAASVRLGRRTI